MTDGSKIIGIGVSVWDSVCSIERLPNRGEVVRAADRVDSLGGGVSVAMATAARLGSSTRLIDALGDDAAGESVVQRLEQEGVDTELIQRIAETTTSSASIWSDLETRERTIVYCPGSACDRIAWLPTMVDAIASASIVHLNGRHPEIGARAIEVAKRHQTKLSFDGGAHRYRDEIRPMLCASEIVIVARQFAECHCDRLARPVAHQAKTSELAAMMMDDLQCAIVGVTDGERGSDWVTADHSFHQEAIDSASAVDTTGCGDTFHGAFLHAINRGATAVEAAALAARVASLNAQSMGGLGRWSRSDVFA
ncbi:MAG: carbohydrate kinase family protein [Planctomycetota bacterium]